MATCRGIDVSAYQGAQNWTSRKAEGVVFAFAKASEGQTTHDSGFAGHIKSIKAAGLVPGGYHFAWPNQEVVKEAANYVATVKPYAGRGFTHWLDLERYTDGRNYAGRTPAQIKAYATAWIAAVQKAFPGQRVGVYTSADDIAKGHVPAGVPLWYPAYTWGSSTVGYATAEAHAQPRPSGRAPLFWQFTSTPVDRSICYLTAAQLRDWAAGDEPDAPEEDDMPDNWDRKDVTKRSLPVGKWTDLNIGGTTLASGITRYTATTSLTVEAPAGGTIQARYYHLRKDKSRWTSPIVERLTTDGSSFPDFTHGGSVDAGETVHVQLVYYPAKADDKTPATITAAHLRGLTWK